MGGIAFSDDGLAWGCVLSVYQTSISLPCYSVIFALNWVNFYLCKDINAAFKLDSFIGFDFAWRER